MKETNEQVKEPAWEYTEEFSVIQACSSKHAKALVQKIKRFAEQGSENYFGASQRGEFVIVTHVPGLSIWAVREALPAAGDWSQHRFHSFEKAEEFCN